MKIIIDTDTDKLHLHDDAGDRVINIYSKEAFEILSDWWVKVGWSLKYPYTFSWLGRPTIQLPEDLIRVQEAIYQVGPDVIIETGVAHGGSLVFYASLCKAMNKGRVIGIDIEIRAHNRVAIEEHGLSSYITLIEGDSVDPVIVNRVKSLVAPGETAFVILDSLHTYEHVLKELEAYSGLVTSGSYIVATDGITQAVYDTPRGKPEWITDHATASAEHFARAHPEFLWSQPVWPFNESELSKNITHWPGAWLKRL